jgi:hypothetical protein
MTRTASATSPAAFCGTLKVPLDWQSRGGPDISVCYRWYPATGSGRPEGTVLPVEGGPGYPSILSVAPYGFRDMYGPVLQNYQGPTGTPVFAAVAGTCADALNTRWRGAGGYVHASDLFTSAALAQDVAAVIRALQVPKVDVRFVEFANETHVVGEGDSYGCASSMIQAFVTDPATLASLSTSCAAAIPSLRAVGSYPASLSAVTPVTLTSGRASAIMLKLAAAAGDAVARYSSVGSSPDAGSTAEASPRRPAATS